jgi:hypothetical protein
LKQSQAIICKQKMAAGLMTFAVNLTLALLYYLKHPQFIIIKLKRAAGLMTFAVNLTLAMLLF